MGRIGGGMDGIMVYYLVIAIKRSLRSRIFPGKRRCYGSCSSASCSRGGRLYTRG